METGIQQGTVTNQREIVAGIKVVESTYRVDKPQFVDVIVERPIFKEKQIDIPIGMDKMVIAIADDITDKVLKLLDAKLSSAIDARIKEIEVPKIIQREEFNIITKDVHVNNAVITDVPVANAVLQDHIVKNPIIEDISVTNAIITDQSVMNVVLKDRIVINPIFEDVVIQRPKFVDKEIVVIHPKYIDMKGNPE